MTLTQQNTRDVGDGVGVLLQSLKRSIGDAADGFARTVGDEAAGFVDEPGDAVLAALTGLRPGPDGAVFRVGIGVAGADAGDAAAARSRVAVERTVRAPVPVAIEAGPAGVAFDGLPTAPETAAAAEGALILLGDVVARRSAADWAVVDLLLPGVRGQQKAIAEALGVTVQAVSQTVARARWREEVAGRATAELLLRLAAILV